MSEAILRTLRDLPKSSPEGYRAMFSEYPVAFCTGHVIKKETSEERGSKGKRGGNKGMVRHIYDNMKTKEGERPVA